MITIPLTDRHEEHYENQKSNKKNIEIFRFKIDYLNCYRKAGIIDNNEYKNGIAIASSVFIINLLDDKIYNSISKILENQNKRLIKDLFESYFSAIEKEIKRGG